MSISLRSEYPLSPGTISFNYPGISNALDRVDGAKQKLTSGENLIKTAYQQELFTSALNKLIHLDPYELGEMNFVRSESKDKLQGFAFTFPVSEKGNKNEVYEFYVLSLVGSPQTWFAVHRAPANRPYLSATLDTKGHPKLVSPDAYKSPEQHHPSLVAMIPTTTLSSVSRGAIHKLLHAPDSSQLPLDIPSPQTQERYQLPLGYKLLKAAGSKWENLRKAAHTAVNAPVNRLLFSSTVPKTADDTVSAKGAPVSPEKKPSRENLPPDERTQALLDLHRINPYQITYTQERHPTGVEYVWFEFPSGKKIHRIAVYADSAEHMIINADGTKTFLSRPLDLTGEYTDLLNTIHKAVLNGRSSGQIKVSTPPAAPIQAASLLDDETLRELGQKISYPQKTPKQPKKATNGPLFADGDPNGVREYYESHPKHPTPPTPDVLVAYSAPPEEPSYHEIFSAKDLVNENNLPSWMRSTSPRPSASTQLPHAFSEDSFSASSLLDADVANRLSWLDPDIGVDIAERKTQPLRVIPRQTPSSLLSSPQALFDSRAPQIQQAAARLNIPANLGKTPATDTKQTKISKQGGSPIEVRRRETLATVARKLDLPPTEFIDEKAPFSISSHRNRFSPSY